MKKLFSAIGLYIAILSSFYFGGCFIEAEFDISQWDKGARGAVGTIGFLAATAGGLVYYFTDQEPKNQY